MQYITKDQVTIKIHIEPESASVRGNCVQSGDDDYDRDLEDEILDRLEKEDTCLA